MALISALVDDFNDSVVDPAKWPNSFGTYAEVGGRARVTCDTGFNAYSSGLLYTLAESAVYLRGYPPAAGGATTEAWAQILIKSDVGGTDLGFELRALTGELVMFSRAGYFDAAAVNIPYSATDHAWLRVRETGGTTYWDTSPDAATWTNRRTLASPAWVSATDLEFQLIAHRSDGTPDYAEFDNVNIAGTIVALDIATETDAAQAIGAAKSRALPAATETETVQPLGRSKQRALPVATATDAAQALGSKKTAALNASSETDTGITLGRSKQRTLGVATAAEAAQPLGRRKTLPLTPAAGIEAGVDLGARKTRSLTLAAETDTAAALGVHVGLDDIDVTVGQPYSPWSAGQPQGASWPVGAPH
ncbi:hypothetical protein [Streptomyces sp. NBC_01530]|uniref:hypothetical protein n=1 Tax=Streptomyces sp. NBC_01530 TaxID=2903895 RepID=UPI0038686BEB